MKKTDKRRSPPNNSEAIATLLLLDLFECPTASDTKEVVRAMEGVIKKLKLNIIKKAEYHFAPYGFTLVYLLKESHFSVHTWPEHNCLCVDLFNCTPLTKKQTQIVLEVFLEYLKPGRHHIERIERGEK